MLDADHQVASAREFTIPNGAFDHHAGASTTQAAPEYTANVQGRSAVAPVAGNGYGADQWRHDGGVAVQTR
jgi:hypothetical protein